MKAVQVRNVFFGMGALFFTILLSGCLKDVTNKPQTPQTYISVMHLAPRAPSVDVFLDGSKATQNGPIAPLTVSLSYSKLTPAMFAVYFKKAGEDSLVAGIPTGLYDSLKYCTLLLYNIDSTHAQAVKIPDDFSVLTADKAYYRFFQMSPDIGNVDVYLNNNKLETNRGYADNTTSYYYNRFFALTPGTYSVYVKKAGTDSVIAQASSATFAAANAFTIYLKGIAGGSGTNALSVGILQANDR